MYVLPRTKYKVGLMLKSTIPLPSNLYWPDAGLVIVHLPSTPNSPFFDIIVPFTERSLITIKLPSTPAILSNDASVKDTWWLNETSLKKVIPLLVVDSCILSKDASVRLMKVL